jgi:hypothetical protein
MQVNFMERKTKLNVVSFILLFDFLFPINVKLTQIAAIS